MAPAERLRPIGASAEEEVCENGGTVSADTKHQEGGGERPVHIVIKPQEKVATERKGCREGSQCLSRSVSHSPTESSNYIAEVDVVGH